MFIGIVATALIGCKQSNSVENRDADAQQGDDAAASGISSNGATPNRYYSAHDQYGERKNDPESADLRILFIGNSHSSIHDLPGLVATMIESDAQGKSVFVQLASSAMFLEGHAKHPLTLQAVRSQNWDFVILQAQKYSTTGRYSYPYDGAITLAELAQEQGAQVVMYPEWARRDFPEETARIHNLHKKIAGEVDAIVAPVGYAWERALAEKGEFEYHAQDGNHCSEYGAFLTACVFYEVLTGEDSTALPAVESVPLSADDQAELRKLVHATLAEHPPIAVTRPDNVEATSKPS